MTHQRIQPHRSHSPSPGLSDDQVEAHGSSTLDAAPKTGEERRDGAVAIVHTVDNRTVFHRMAAWWRLCACQKRAAAADGAVRMGAEPEWRGHWASTKYL